MGTKVKSFLTDQDQVGVPVSLSYKSEDSHKTVVGGVCSIFCSLFIVFYSVTLIGGLIWKPSTNEISNYEYEKTLQMLEPVLNTTDYEMFHMIGIRSAQPNPGAGVEYDQNDAYDVKIITHGLDKDLKPYANQTISFVNCKDLIGKPGNEFEFQPTEHHADGTTNKSRPHGIFSDKI